MFKVGDIVQTKNMGSKFKILEVTKSSTGTVEMLFAMAINVDICIYILPTGVINISKNIN